MSLRKRIPIIRIDDYNFERSLRDVAGAFLFTFYFLNLRDTTFSTC